MRLTTETIFLGVWGKQTRLGGVGGGWLSYMEILSLCIVYIIPQDDTLYASQVELTLFLFYFLWRDKLQIDVLICPHWRTDASTTVPCSCCKYNLYWALSGIIFANAFLWAFSLETTQTRNYLHAQHSIRTSLYVGNRVRRNKILYPCVHWVGLSWVLYLYPTSPHPAHTYNATSTEKIVIFIEPIAYGKKKTEPW